MRRTVLLLCAAVPLLFAPPALANDGQNGQVEKAESACRPPEVDHRYDTEELRVEMRLPASGCSSWENSVFMVSAQLTRTDELGPQESVSHAVRCGPFIISRPSLANALCPHLL